MGQPVGRLVDGVVHDIEQAIDMPGTLSPFFWIDAKSFVAGRAHCQQVEPLPFDCGRRARFLAPGLGDKCRPLLETEHAQLSFNHTLGRATPTRCPGICWRNGLQGNITLGSTRQTGKQAYCPV